ncbi:endonuclease/exonuclease/phosphatase family protein [Patescibacteria group bacterium]|nr:endonuclease/exonuclease/phosphatase family protein [Patescibacteria group bacterium]
MKIISWNVNGIRSAIAQDFWDQIKATKADIVCLQELKIDQGSFTNIKIIDGYETICNHAEKKGYSGVAVIFKKNFKPKIKMTKQGDKRFDNEGRYLELDFGDFILINIYLPHGGRQKENLGYKLSVYEKLITKLDKLKNNKVVAIGDFNIAHAELDLARPKNNKNNIMFTVEERAQIGKIIRLGYTDTFRQFFKEGGHYTW